MRKLLKEKNILILLFVTTLIVFFLAERETKKFDDQYLDVNIDSLNVGLDTSEVR